MSATRVFGFPDIHWSERDEPALEVAIAAQRIFKPDWTVVGGDLLNCGPYTRHGISTFKENHGYDLIESELKPASAFLDVCQKNTKDGRLSVIEGNHDAWLERFLVNIPGGASFQSLLPSKYLMRNRKNAWYIPWNMNNGGIGHVRLHRNLIVVHGWAAPKFAADRHLQMAKPHSIIYHHTHRAETRTNPMFDGTYVSAWNAGCLCKRKPIYAHGQSPTDWTHGFWVAYIGRTSFTVYTVLVEKGRAVMPDGREVGA